jgi:hypothetical protein
MGGAEEMRRKANFIQHQVVAAGDADNDLLNKLSHEIRSGLFCLYGQS